MQSRGTRIELLELNKYYGSVKVVDNVSATIEAGEFVSFLGPSGSGKTTTLTMVAGFVSVSSGQILVDGEDMAAIPPQKRGFGMVFQNYSLFPHLDVFENIAFPLRLRGVPREEIQRRVQQALLLVQLPDFGARRISQLSGGQQQRVAMARAVVYEPSLVLMDEPMGALDKNLRFAMQTEIKEIQRQLGMTVIYVTHDQEEAMNMSDRIVIMKDGRIEQIGAPSEVYTAPKSEFVAQFLGEANLLKGTISSCNKGIAKLVLAGGATACAVAPQRYENGAQVSLFVRPEKIRLTRAKASTADNEVPGQVTRCSFLGNFRRYSIRLAGGDMASVDQPNAGDAELFGVDDTVKMTWRAADCQVIGAGA